jgi:2-polyprenyl-6-methoxyphenol hydroxylase-like FAD-dependent oxidoreductase
MEPVVIAGAGIGGLSAAISLARHGFAVTVYERVAQLREVGAGIQLGPNAFRMFERLGVQHAMQEIAFEPRAIVLMDSLSGSEICRQRLTGSFQSRFGYPYRVGHRTDVQKVLLQAARSYPDRVELRLGEGVRSFVQTERNVTVTLEGGATAVASALIGADGLWSVVRQAILGDGPPRVSGHIAYRAVLSAPDISPDLLSDNVEVWVGPRHHLVCYKVSGGNSLNIVAIFHSSRYLEGWDTSGDAAELNAGFADACSRVRRLLSFVQTWRMWVLCDRDPMRGWSRGRVTLLGDAAHPTLPYLAQGACMALEDAVSLADRIARQSDNVPAALSEYERVRLERTASVQQTAREMGEIYHADGQAREARNKALAARDPDDHEPNAWLFGTDGPRDVTSTTSFFGRVR